jgi:pimeloyl-ACP methyl ester carboxylesterase
VIALNLRGHGDSPVSKPLNKCTMADYVDDVRWVADTLPTTPVLIGHSMGGFIVQKYLERAAQHPPQSWCRQHRREPGSSPRYGWRGSTHGWPPKPA